MKIDWKPYGDEREFTGKIETGTYQVHTADRMVGQNTGKFVASYWQDIEELRKSDLSEKKRIDGYLAVIDGVATPICGNWMFCASGLPDFAEYSTPEEAMKVCELHFSQKGNIS